MIQHSDGQAIAGTLVGLIDETSPQMGAGVYYVMSTAVVMEAQSVQLDLDAFFSDTLGRSRPFHWLREGPAARQRMVDLIVGSGVVAFSRYQSVARNKQKAARADLLSALIGDLHREQIDHLMIEAGDQATNLRDQNVLLDYYSVHGGVPFVYDWRSKKERLLWIPDAVNGALHDYFASGNASWFEQLVDGGVLSGEPDYLA